MIIYKEGSAAAIQLVLEAKKTAALLVHKRFIEVTPGVDLETSFYSGYCSTYVHVHVHVSQA